MASVNELSTLQWIQSLLEPGYILTKAMSYYVDANLEAVFRRGQVLAPFLRSNQLRDEAFGKFWVAFSSNRDKAVETEEPTATTTTAPTQVQGSADLIPAILAHASGLVLDVGPGTGTQMPFLRSPAIKSIYGAEPCIGLHAELRNAAVSEGLSDKYHIVHSSVVAAELVPALQKAGLTISPADGVFDTISCVRVLCSVPDIERTVKELYSLLKPGGKLLVVEHVVNPWWTAKGSIVARAVQGLYHCLGWRWVMGDCALNRDTEAILRKAAERDGGWESVDLEPWFSRTPIPYIAGILVKKST